MGVFVVTWSFFNDAVCRDAARRAGLSATADPCHEMHTHSKDNLSLSCIRSKDPVLTKHHMAAADFKNPLFQLLMKFKMALRVTMRTFITSWRLYIQSW